jgi:serine/threonine protein kinase
VPHQTIAATGHSEEKTILQQTRSTAWQDEEIVVWVSIRKRLSNYELAVYSHPEVRNSPFFPKLRNYAIEPHGALRLTLEMLYSQRRVVLGIYYAECESPKLRRLVVARFLLDLMGALRTLHEAGFVHSDLSPGNVGFNLNTGTWQLYDFDRTMPIAESLSKPRSGGTLGYVSKDASDTGIFRPMDDYVALVNTCFHGFSRLMEVSAKSIAKPFLSLITPFCTSPVSERVNVDFCYMQIFEMFCRELESSCQALQDDPSYKAAQPIYAAVKAKPSS